MIFYWSFGNVMIVLECYRGSVGLAVAYGVVEHNVITDADAMNHLCLKCMFDAYTLFPQNIKKLGNWSGDLEAMCLARCLNKEIFVYGARGHVDKYGVPHFNPRHPDNAIRLQLTKTRNNGHFMGLRKVGINKVQEERESNVVSAPSMRLKKIVVSRVLTERKSNVDSAPGSLPLIQKKENTKAAVTTSPQVGESCANCKLLSERYEELAEATKRMLEDCKKIRGSS